MVDAHTAPYSEEEILRFFYQWEAKDYRPLADERYGRRWEVQWTWEQWYAAFPQEKCLLPRVWRSNYGRDFTTQDLMQTDYHVIASSIPPQYIRGAIRITDGHKLLPHIRPGRHKDEILSTRLWRMAREMCASYAGRPIVM